MYNFNIQNLVSFEDNFGYKGDLPIAVHIDFETIGPTGDCFNLELKRMFVVPYVIVFAFHPKLNLDCVILQRSFGHSYKKLTTINYWTNDQMEYMNIKLVKQLKDCTINVSQIKCKNAVAQMFCVELKFAADYLLSWFNKKFKLQNLELHRDKKLLLRQKILSIGTAVNFTFVTFP